MDAREVIKEEAPDEEIKSEELSNDPDKIKEECIDEEDLFNENVIYGTSSVKGEMENSENEAEPFDVFAEDGLVEVRSTTEKIESESFSVSSRRCISCQKQKTSANEETKLGKEENDHQSCRAFPEEDYICSDCMKSNVEKHESVLTNSRPIVISDIFFKCLTCEGTYNQEQELSQHIQSCPGRPKSFNCSQCKYTTSIERLLPRHVQSVHNRIKRRLICSECDYFTGKSSHLTRHILAIHRKIRSFKCVKCNSSFFRKDTLKKHLQSIHNCTLEDNKLNNFSPNHISPNHVESDRVSPNHISAELVSSDHRNLSQNCSQELDQSLGSPLPDDIQPVIIKIKPYECEECESGFARKHHLEDHVRSVHRKLKPFVCYECNKTYSRKSFLAKHVEAIHKKLRPFKCSECAHAFSRKNDLFKHIQTVHMKLRPFRCNVCGNVYSRKDCLTKHIIANHKTESN